MLYIFADSFNSGLIEDSWILHLTCHNALFWLECVKTVCQTAAGNGRSVLVALPFRELWMFFFNHIPRSVVVSLKVGHNMKSEVTWVSFSCSVTVKSIGLPYTLNGSLTHM